MTVPQPIQPERPAGVRVGAGIPNGGDVLRVGRAASVQFVEPIVFRVIKALNIPTYYGWCWLEGYQLDRTGSAVEKRRIFVQLAGLRRVPVPASRPTARQRAAAPRRQPRS